MLSDPDFNLDPAAIRQTPPGVLGGDKASLAGSAAWLLSAAPASGFPSSSVRASSLARIVEPALIEFAGTPPMTVTEPLGPPRPAL